MATRAARGTAAAPTGWKLTNNNYCLFLSVAVIHCLSLSWFLCHFCFSVQFHFINLKYTCDINKGDLSNNSATNRSMEGREGGELETYELLSEHFSPFVSFCLALFCFSLFYCSLSLHREVGQQKRVLMSGPSWRSVPKSKSSGAILQELPSPSWGGGTNAGVFLCMYLHLL